METKDWTGDTNSVFKTLGSTNHSRQNRASLDYYATDPIAAKLLLEQEEFSKNIWECACGEGHLSKIFEESGYNVRNTDIIDRIGNEVFDFLSEDKEMFDGDIITNPPYKYATEFVRKALERVEEGHKVAMFLKVLFLEGKSRRELFKKYPPCRIYVCSGRIDCAKNGDFKALKENGGGALAYAWFIWRKGYKGETIVKWIN